jgi:hypothetical protein
LPGNGENGRVQGYCSLNSNQLGSENIGVSYTNSNSRVPGKGQQCHCRVMDQNGAWSSWGHLGNAGADCKHSCANLCPMVIFEYKALPVNAKW